MGGTVRLYKSTDASAPSLTGQVNSLVTLLDAILVGTAGIAYGSTPSAGWSKPYANSANKGCYRMATTGNSGSYLQIDDSGPGAAGAREARVYGFNAMTALDTGTGRFPTSALLAIGSGSVVWRKSATADATARAWWCVADDSCFYLSVETGDYTSPLTTFTVMFGDIFSLKASDATRCMIIGRNAENDATVARESFTAFNRWNTGNATPLGDYVVGHFMNGHWNQTVAAIAVGKIPDMNKMNIGGLASAIHGSSYTQTSTATCWSGGNNGGYVGMGYPSYNAGFQFPMSPNPPDGGVLISPIWVVHNGAIRGYMKGLWCPIAMAPFGHGDTMSGAGNLAGKSFVNINVTVGYNSGTQGVGNCLFEYSNTWS